MAQIVSTSALVLHVAPFKEFDLRVVALTREFGVIDAIAIGTRRSASKQRSRLEVGVVTTLDIAKGKRSDKVLRSEPIHVPNQIRQSLQKLLALQFFCGLLQETNRRGDVNPDVYLFAAKAVVMLERLEEEKVQWWQQAVALRIMETAGFAHEQGKTLRRQMEYVFEKRLKSWDLIKTNPGY